MTLTRGFIRNAATTPLDARLMDMATLVQNSDGSPRTGVLGAANLGIVTALATMNVAVAAAEFAASKGKADGVALYTNDGVVNVPIAAAPGANSRIDVIWTRHQDNTTGDGASTPIFGVTAGAAAASPTKPAIPTGALELATLRVYAGTTAANGGSNTLTNTYQMTAARGAAVPFRTKVELDAWTNPVDGQEAYVVGESSTYKRIGGAWKLWSRPWTSYVPTTANVVGTPTITARYCVANGIAKVRLHFLLVAANNIGTGPSFSLPVPGVAMPGFPMLGTATYRDVSAGIFGGVILLSATDAQPIAYAVQGTNIASAANVSASVPFAWTTGDFFNLEFEYEVA